MKAPCGRKLWNAQQYTRVNAGKAAFSIAPDFMPVPFNALPLSMYPTMDGFARDYFFNARWQLGRDLLQRVRYKNRR